MWERFVATLVGMFVLQVAGAALAAPAYKVTVVGTQVPEPLRHCKLVAMHVSRQVLLQPMHVYIPTHNATSTQQQNVEESDAHADCKYSKPLNAHSESKR